MNKFTLASVRRTPLAAVLLATFFIGGCSMPTLHSLLPKAPVPAQWPNAAGVPAAASQTAMPAAALPDWQSYFQDADLAALIRIALDNNRDVRIAAGTLAQARAQLGVRTADELPTVNLGAGASRAPNAFGAMSTLFNTGLSVTAYEFDFFGRVASLKEQALAQYLASQEASRTAQISLIGMVAQSWLALQADEALLASTRQLVVSRERTLQLVQLRHQHGVASDIELQQNRALLQSVRVALGPLQRQRMLDENTLVLLLGQDIPAAQKRALGDGALSHNSMAELAPGIPSEVLTQRADIRQAEHLLKAADANIQAARATFFPRIALTAGVGSASSELSSLFSSGSWVFSVAPQLLLPLFDHGRNDANLAAAQAARAVAVAQYEKTIQSAFREVSDALTQRSGWQAQREAQQAQHAANQARLELVQLKLAHGAASALDVLEAERSVLADQQALVLVQSALLQNQIALYKALGGGLTRTP